MGPVGEGRGRGGATFWLLPPLVRRLSGELASRVTSGERRSLAAMARAASRRPGADLLPSCGRWAQATRAQLDLPFGVIAHVTNPCQQLSKQVALRDLPLTQSFDEVLPQRRWKVVRSTVSWASVAEGQPRQL